VRLLLGLVVGFLGTALAQECQISGPMPARENETCAVCSGRVGWKGRAYLVDGQRFAVMQAMEPEFLREPLRYVSKLRPENMLFSARAKNSATPVYLYGGMLVLLSLVAAGWWWHTAMLEKRPAWASSALTALGKIPLTREAAPCGACGSPNHPSAPACSRCGAAMEPTAPSEVSAIWSG